LAQAIFEPKPYLYKYPSNIILVILPDYTTYEDGTECSEMSAHKIQMPQNHPKERTTHSEHGESMKSRITLLDNYLIRFYSFQNSKFLIYCSWHTTTQRNTGMYYFQLKGILFAYI